MIDKFIASDFWF